MPPRRPVVLAFLHRIALLDDDPGHRSELALEPVVGLLQSYRHLARPRRRHRPDPVEDSAIKAAVGRVHLPVEAVHHVGSGDRAAVPERRAGPQREHGLGRRRIGDGREAGPDRAIWRLAQQGLTHQRDGGVLWVVEGVDRVERVHITVDGPRHRGHRLRPGRRGCDQALRRRDAAGCGAPADRAPAGRGQQCACCKDGRCRRYPPSPAHLSSCEACSCPGPEQGRLLSGVSAFVHQLAAYPRLPDR